MSSKLEQTLADPVSTGMTHVILGRHPWQMASAPNRFAQYIMSDVNGMVTVRAEHVILGGQVKELYKRYIDGP